MSYRRDICLALALTVLATAATPVLSAAQEGPLHTRRQDVIYGRKHGVALTMDVFTPRKEPNGAAAVFVVSGGWFSSHDFIGVAGPGFVDELARRGYTVRSEEHTSELQSQSNLVCR